MKLKLVSILLILISLAPLAGLIGPDITDAHDSISHVVRTASFYQSLTEGNLVPRWAQTLNYGYGHPIFMFLYPLPSYFAALFHWFGFPFILSVKLVMALSFALAGLFAFLWFREILGVWPAVVGTAVFQLAPYRFVNLYVRNAFGENTATLFIPLVFWLFTRLIRQPGKKNLIFATLALAGLLLSHNAISLMVLPVLLVYTLIFIWPTPSRLTPSLYALAAIILGFSLPAFFWLPAFVEGKYTLRDIVTAGDTFAAHFPTLKQLIIPSWGYSVSVPGPNDGMSFQIGLTQLLSFAIGTFILIKRQFKSPLLILSWLVFTGSFFLLLPVSLPIWRFLTIIKKFQFPWRFLTLSVLSASMLAAISASYFKITARIAALLVVLLVLQTVWYWQPQDFLPQTEPELISSYTGTTDTGESSPLWSVRFQEQPAPFGLSVVSGAPIDYQIIRRQSEIHEYTVTATVDSQISDNTLYFPGWTAYVDGQERPITYADPNWRGEITFKVPTGTHRVKVVFEETHLRRLANLISLATAGFLLFIMLKPKLYVKI